MTEASRPTRAPFLLFLSVCLLLSGCAAGMTAAKLRAEHTRLTEHVEVFINAWRWGEPEVMAQALQYAQDVDRMRKNLDGLEILDLQLRNVVLLGEEMDQAKVDLFVSYRSPDSQSVKEKTVSQEWYRVERSWYLEPVPGILPF